MFSPEAGYRVPDYPNPVLDPLEDVCVFFGTLKYSFEKLIKYQNMGLLNASILAQPNLCSVNMKKLKKTQYRHFYDKKPMNSFCTKYRGQNISILHLSCRTSDLQSSLVLQTHALVL